MARTIPSLYRHEQATLANTWTINHKLGGAGGAGIPIIDVTVLEGSTYQKMIPGVTTMIDANNISITFSEPRVGFAIVIA
jgi:hypothetical protein